MNGPREHSSRRRTRRLAVARFVFAAWALLLAAPAHATVGAGAGLRVAIAPFEDLGGDLLRGREVAALLARELARRSAALVSLPEQLKSNPTAKPEASEIRRWATATDVDVVIVGATQTGKKGDVAVDADVRWGHSGVSISTFRELADGGEIEPAVVKLAGLISVSLGADEALARSAAPLLPPERVSTEVGSQQAEGEAADEADSESASSALVTLRKDEPLSIESEELEVTQKDGTRHLIFTENVHVVQGDIELATDRLDAFYPKDGSQPDQLIATGSVSVHQGDRKALCDRAIYERAAQTVVCSGHAELHQGCDQVRGREIEFDLDSESVRVIGQASVVLRPRDEEASPCSKDSLP